MTPEMRKALGTLTDCQLLHVVSEIMGYHYEETYAIAHKQVHVEGDPWESWSHNFSYEDNQEYYSKLQIRILNPEAYKPVLPRTERVTF